MIDKATFEDIGSFLGQKINDEKSLEYNIPILLGSLKSWMEKGKPTQTRNFLQYLYWAFDKAKEFEIIGRENIERYHSEYKDLIPAAMEVIKRKPAY